MKEKVELPKALSFYSKSDYSIQQKARFVYYLIIAAVIGIIFLTISSAFIQLNSDKYNGIFLPVIIPMIFLLFLFVACFILLIKGKYIIASHLLVILSMISIWYIMWVDVGDNISRLDTLVLIIALINLMPLFTTRYKSVILYYSIANVLTLIIFISINREKLMISNSTAVDIIIDTSIAIIFTGIVGYNIFRINKQSLEKVESDNLKRISAENALKQSELLRRRVFESSNTPIIVMDSISFKYIDINTAAVKIYGFPSREASLGKTPLDVSAPVQYDGTPSSQKAVSYIEQVLEEGSVTFEWLHQRPNGELWDAEVHLLSFQSDGQTLLQFSLNDITGYKLAEKNLKESQRLFQTLAQVSPVGIFRTKANGYTTYVNPKWIELSGLSFEEAMGDGWLNAVHPEDKEEIQKNWKLHSGKKEKSTAEYRFIKPDGNIVWVLGNAEPEMLDNKIQGYIGTITDITERKLAEKELKESEEKYRTLMESMNEVVMMIDNEDRIQYVNKNFSDKLGYLTEEAVGEIGFKFLFDSTDLEVIKNASFNRNKNMVAPYELAFASKSGQKIIFLVSAAPMISSEGEDIGFILAMADITKQKKIEQELEKYRNHLELLVQERTEELATSNEELTSTNEELHNQREELEVVLLNLQKTQKQLIQAEKMASLGVLASGVAHEINNPLNFIKGGAFGLEQYFDENLKDHKEKVYPLIEGINMGIERAANIVTSLNHYSRRNDSKLIECDIHAIIDNCLAILRNETSNRIEIEKNYTTKLHLLNGNEGKLHQAILNILSNAVQAINDKGSINIKTNIFEQKIIIRISDTGCGISDENMSKIFDPFFTTKEVGKGTGLGLSITHNIIEEHRGNIEFESDLENGTTVKIILPINKA